MGNKRQADYSNNSIKLSLEHTSRGKFKHGNHSPISGVLTLFYLLACVKGNGKWLSVIESVNRGRAHLEKVYSYQSPLLGRKAAQPISQMTHRRVSVSAAQPHLILLPQNPALPALTLVCLHEFLSYFPSPTMHIPTHSHPNFLP